MSLTIDQSGSGRPAMIVHGGGGPLTVAPLSAHLAETMHAVTPTLPGWNGVPRPESIQAIGDIAGVFLDWLAEHDLTDVLVVGSSIGGWIAAEMAVRDRKTSISGLVLIDTVGIEVAGEPITDLFALTGVAWSSTRSMTPTASSSTRPRSRPSSSQLSRPTWPACAPWPAIRHPRVRAGVCRRLAQGQLRAHRRRRPPATDRGARADARADRRVRVARRSVAVSSQRRHVGPWG